MTHALTTALQFLISIVFDIYLLILGVRFILVWARADYFNLFTLFIIKLTQSAVQPLRRFFPNIRMCETASLVLIFVLNIIKFSLLTLVTWSLPNMWGILVLASADIIKMMLNIFFYSILIVALMSWFQPNQTQISQFLARLSSPVIRPLQRIIPRIHGIDISPIPALIIIQFIMILLVSPLFEYGRMLTGL